MSDNPLNDMRMARPTAVTDIWDISDLTDRLENLINRLELILRGFAEICRLQRVKEIETVLQSMIEEKEEKNGGNKHTNQ